MDKIGSRSCQDQEFLLSEQQRLGSLPSTPAARLALENVACVSMAAEC